MLRSHTGEGSHPKDEDPFDIFHVLIGGLYDTNASRRERERFSVHSHRKMVGASAITRGEWGAQAVYRRPEHIKRQNAEFVGVRLTVGRSITVIGDEVFIQKDPAIVLSDFSRPRASKSTRMRSCYMFLPHSLLGYDPSRHAPETIVPTSSVKGQILQSFMSTTVREIFDSSGARSRALVNDAAALFRAMLLDDATAQGRATFQTARAAAMREFLLLRLRDQDLGIPHLMTEFGASRATIYRDFEPYGGVAGYVASERLKRIALDIADRRPDRGVVSTVSERWGFPSVQDFSRAFRRRFGIAPSDIAGLRYCEWAASAPTAASAAVGLTVRPPVASATAGWKYSPSERI